MILTQADGTKREISSDELREIMRDARERVTPETKIERFDAGVGPTIIRTTVHFRSELAAEPDRASDPDRGIAEQFVVDADGHLIASPLWQRGRRRASRLRFCLASVIVAALVGLIVAGL